jgi:hypothetical protein
MEKQQENRENLIREIIAIELEMFQNVKAKEHAFCQELPDTFRTMRWMAHSVLSDDTLASYLDDLKQAAHAGRNLMTEKYARMEDLIPPLKNDPEIIAILDEITEVEKNWMQEFSQHYPGIVKGDGAGFAAYLRCELETYSDRTLKFYLSNVTDARARGINLAEKSYVNLFKKLGYESLDDVVKET